jgi:hypothetical protein
MRAEIKKEPATRARAPNGKKQMLVIMDQDLIKHVKMAALQDDRKMSHAVEEAVREWLAKRKARKGTGSKRVRF